jgi:hypothetical protein
MPQIGFFIGTGGIGLFGIPLGMANVVIAWDAFNRGAGSGLGSVYKAFSSSNVVGGGRLRSYKPIQVAPYRGSGPLSPLGHGNIVRLALSGHSNLSAWADMTLKVFDGDGKQLYSAAEGTGGDTLRVQLSGYATTNSLNFEETFDNTYDKENQAIFDSLMSTGRSAVEGMVPW